MITEDTIRERLAADRRKPSRLATWEEIEFLLDIIDTQRAAARRVWTEVEVVDGHAASHLHSLIGDQL